MKFAMLFAVGAVIVFGSMLTSVEEANAVVCARGVYRAGCAGPRGAAVARRPVYAPYRRGVVVRRVY